MGVVVPNFASSTEDRASGAQVIDGSLKFDKSKNQYLQWTPSSPGNRKTWTFSCWIKRNNLGDGSTSTTAEVVFSSGAVSVPWGIIQLNNNNTIQSSVFAGSSAGLYTNAVFRDTGSFFHLCSVFDTTATGNDKWRTYINGVQQTYSNSNYPSDNTNYQFNQANANHRIGYGEWYAGFQMSQCYFIDGQALGPENFGYTDPLTNTWRPKKASSSVFDKTYINDWVSQTTGTPYSGSYAIENAFNGTLSNRCSAADNTSIVFTPTTPIPINNSLRIYAKSDTLSGIFNINGVNEIGLLSNSLQWVSPSTIPSTLISLEWATASGGLEESAVGAIEIDGNILLFGNVNTFYLPMDGNSQIGEDKSGNGNNWTPINFGGSNTIEKATGAKPILNTLGGTIARPGVFGSEVSKYYAVTVPGGTGGGFYLDGTQKPALNLIRGATYTFDQSDSSNSSHPLVFGTTAEGNDYSDGVTTSGTPGSAGAYTKITVPHNAPDTLYYHCSNHSGMGNSTSQTTNEKVADPYAWKNVLALPLVGSANDVSNQINSGSSTKTITVTNAVASSVQSNFYGGSYYFDGTGDYLTFTSGSDLQFGSGEFTIECYVYPNTLSNYDPIIDNGSIAGNNQHDWRLYLGSAGEVWFDIEHSNGSYFNASGVSAGVNYGVKANKWNHIAITRSGNTIYTFVNGVQQATTSFSGTIDSDYTTAYIGHDVMVNGTSYYFDGYMSDIRVYKGVAKYTSNFIPASTDPDILPDTPSGVSGGSKLTKITDGAVAFDGSGDYLELADSDDFNFGSGNFTIEFFVNPSSISRQTLFAQINSSGTNASSSFYTEINSSAQWRFLVASGSTSYEITAGTAVANKWTHLAYVRSGNTTTLYVDGVSIGTGDVTGVTVNNSSEVVSIGRYPGGLNFTGFISNLRVIKGTALYTSNFTPPTRALTNVTNTKLLCAQSTTLSGISDAAVLPSYAITVKSSNSGSGSVGALTAVTSSGNYYYDTPSGGSAWIQLDFASTQSSVTSIKLSGGGYQFGSTFDLYVNGVLVENDRSTQAAWAEDTIAISSTNIDSIRIEGSDGYSIGALKFNDTLVSGSIGGILANGNASATNFNPFTTDINAVRGQESGYATLSPLMLGSGSTLSDGNLNYVFSSADTWSSVKSPFILTSGGGKYYWEVTSTGETSSNQFNSCGITSTSAALSGPASGSGANAWVYDTNPSHSGAVRHNGSIIVSGTTSGAVRGDIINITFDSNTGLIRWYVNNVFSNQYTVSTGFDYYPILSVYNSSMSVNFGQKPFKFPPPDGFQLLNASTVRPSTVIARPDQYVGISTWVGDSAASRNIESGIKPDLVWLKNRFVDGRSNYLYDSVRGFGANKEIVSNQTVAEGSVNHSTDQSGYVSGTTASGFTLTAGSIDSVYTNESGQSYVGWTWKAGGNKNTFNVDDVGYATASAAGLDGGSVNPTGASVGTKQGFSIIKWNPTPATVHTVSHGLGKIPKFMIFKQVNASSAWSIYHEAIGATNRLTFTNGTSTSDTVFGSTAPTDTVFTNQLTSNSNIEGIAYLWADVPGLQKFGSYEGNDADGSGPFVELGFRPAVVMLKNADAVQDWILIDATRDTHNVSYKWIKPNSNVIENTVTTNNSIDILSNGFISRGALASNDAANGPSQTIIYAAWAEAPSFNLFGAQSNAR